MSTADVVDDFASRTMTPLPDVQQQEEQQQQQQLIGTGVNVGELTLNSGMKPALRRLCEPGADPADKARALELLTALELADTIKQEASGGAARVATASSFASRCSTPASIGERQAFRRPRTAAARVETNGTRGPFSAVNSYETTHNYFFQPPAPTVTHSQRPASSQMQRVVPPKSELAPGNGFSDMYMQTTYDREFFPKPDGRGRPERAASARGVRNNNPHPNQEFLVWRYRRPVSATDRIEASAASASSQSPALEAAPEFEELTNETFDRAVRGKCRSVYKTDFVGAAEPPAALTITKAPTYDRSTTTRRVFAKPPPVPPEMSVPTTRFSKKRFVQRGVLPDGGVSRHSMGTQARTTYELHIGEPANRLMRVSDLRQLSNAHNAQAVARMLEDASGEERVALFKLYKEMESRKHPASIPMPAERHAIRQRLTGPLRMHPRPAWMSTWTGP